MEGPTGIRATSLLSDEEIVQRVCDGDTALFEVLMRRHNQRLFRAVSSVIGTANAEDVMQQAYINAFRSLRQYEGRSRFSTWLVRIAVNEALARRAAQRERETDLDEELYQRFLEEARSTLPDPEEAAMGEEMRRLLESVILALPESYRSVVMMREVEGLSTVETAECLSVSEDVVKTRLHRARAMMKDELLSRAGTSLDALFQFHDRRCDRVVRAVFERIERERIEP